YNSYASFTAGYWGKSGTISAFSEERSYNYSTNYYQNLWNATYDNLEDYQQIQTKGTGATNYPYHAAIARIMKVYNFLLLVDEYGDIPYSTALLGLGNVTPTYDKQADIYKDLIVQLKGAIADINATNAAKTATFTPRAVGAEDVVFRGDMARWKQFANSLRLRILLRESSTTDGALNSYVATEMAALQTSATTEGYITTDVVVQPGYAANTGQQNPFYNRYGVAAGATAFNAEYSYIVPTKYIIRQYESNSDMRISQLYRLGTVDSVAAYSGTDLGEPNPPQFDPETRRVGSRFLNGGAFLKGATAPTVLMLLSEHLFSKAEAESRVLLTGNAQQDYLDGIRSSFITTYRAAATTPAALTAATATTTGVSQYNAYIAANSTNGLV
ncbi:MAG: SusD/RagB family nutrient-binding outer membrane lipoprotein, partial [Hymenobacter sp.]